MNDLESKYNQLLDINCSIIRLPSDIGKFKKDQIVILDKYAFKIMEEHYKEMVHITVNEYIDEAEDIMSVDLQYLLDNQSDLKKTFYDNPKKEKTVHDMIDEIFELKVNKETKKISEYIVKHFLARNKVYTVRDDNTSEIWIYKEGIYVSEGKTYIQQFVRSLLESDFKMPICKEIVDKIMIDTYINPDEFFSYDDNIEFIPVQNGLLNIDTRKIHPFNPEMVFFNKLPVKFSPSCGCPQIKQFFKDICRDKSDIETLQQFLGTCIEREQKYERMLMCIGGGRNGKSKFADLVKKFLGSYNCAGMQPSSLENPDNFNTYMLHGKLANMYMDIAKTSLKNTSLIKSLSGGDPITVPRKYKSPLTFKNTAKFIFGANELPYSYDITSGFWERWLLIDFPYTFLYEDRLEKLEESDKWKHKLRIDNITDIICSEEEMSGLLNWVLEGLHKLRLDGRFSYKYTPDQVKSLWVRKSDSFSAFFMDYMEVDYEKKISKTELRKVYSEYCKEHQIKIMSDVHINKIMGENGISGTRFQEHGKSDTYWIGASFKTGYRAETSLDGVVTFQKPTSGDEVKTYIETNKDATKQDLIMKFGHGFVNKMLQNGDLIIIGKDKVAIK